MRISDWSSDVCSSDLNAGTNPNTGVRAAESRITGTGAIRLLGNASAVTIDGFEFTATQGAVGFGFAAILLPPGVLGGNVAPFNHFVDISIRNNWFHDLEGRPVLKDCFASDRKSTRLTSSH